MSWKAHRDPKTIGPFEVQYMTSSAHRHEGAHRIAVAGREVLVLPDGRTTARNRNAVITRVLDAIQNGDSSTLGALVGALVLEGVTSLAVDGDLILDPDSTRVVSLRLDVIQTDDDPGAIEVRLSHLGDG